MTTAKTVSRTSLRKRSIVSFLVLFVFAAFGFYGWHRLRGAETEDGIPSVLRRIFDLNESVTGLYSGRDRVDFVIKKKIPKGKQARVNGDLGLRSPIDIEKWTLAIETPPKQMGFEYTTQVLKMTDIKSFPKTEITKEFFCVEGWSEVMSFGGVPFRDFIRKYKLGTRSGNEPDWENNPKDMYRFVGLETPDGGYYVSIDMKSMLNPHTLLAYEQNGEPLTEAHGAPLRLYIPVKYGVKSLKRVGKIFFSDEPLADYWGEVGYDWFLGL